MGPVRLHAADQPDAEITLKVYPGTDGSFLLYEDAGDGYGYEHGEYARFTLNWNEGSHTLTIGRPRHCERSEAIQLWIVEIPA